jgi:hypothetical protein
VRYVPILAVIGLLVGCKPPVDTPQTAPSPTASATTLPVVFEKGWPDFWRDPANAVDTLNRTGARLGAYAAKNGAYQAEAMPTALDLKPSDTPNTAYITLRGAEKQLDQLVYRLDLRQPDQGPAAAKALGEMIVNSFRVLGLSGAREVAAALNAGKDMTGSVDGAQFRVASEPAPELGAGLRRLVVTFSRTGANAPATSQTAKDTH